MSFADVRSVVESKVFTTFQNLAQPVEVMFDNVQDTPPALPYVVCIVQLHQRDAASHLPRLWRGRAPARAICRSLLRAKGQGHEGPRRLGG